MIPIGGIISWSGAIVDIPSNFALCNGANGTPDLRDKFVVGAGSSYAVAASGGSATHFHAMALGNPSGNFGVDAGTGQMSDYSSNLPPYYALAQIMRIS